MKQLKFYLFTMLFFWLFLYDNPPVLAAVAFVVYLIIIRYAPDFIDKTLR